MRALAGAAVLAALVGTGLLLPVPSSTSRIDASPVEAAAAAEARIPALGLVWGRVRGWQRLEGGWSLVWQPAHGAWLLRAWVPDDGDTVRWRLLAAPWLPGVRLSRAAAAALAGVHGGPTFSTERLARRDWQFGSERVLGCLPAGGGLPAAARGKPSPWAAILLGLMLAGAVALAALPGIPAAAWRWWLTCGWGAVAALLPWTTPLAYDSFQVAVRPWVAQLSFMAQLVLLAAAIVLLAWRFPIVRGRADGLELAAGLGAGLLAGRIAPGEWVGSVAGLSIHVLLWVVLAFSCAWAAAVAAYGLRELVWFAGPARPLLGLGLTLAAIPTAGVWLGPAVAVGAAAAVPRSRGGWVALAVTTGWIVGSVVQVCGAWTGPLRDATAALLVACGAVAVVLARSRRS